MPDETTNEKRTYTRHERWRLALGSDAQDCVDGALQGSLAEMDKALSMLYGGGSTEKKGRGGSGRSMPSVARWLDDIRTYFPTSVVRVMQQDAFERLNLRQMLLQPEMLEAIVPDVNLVAQLMSMNGVIPEKTKETARAVVRKVVNELMKKLEEPMRSAVKGALNRAERNRRPRLAEMDWPRTIRANLRHYQADYGTIIPETLIGYGRKAHRAQREVILCIDQSGSMASSIVYSSIFGAVMASLPAIKTRLVLFDTEIVDLTDQMNDPVDVLFGVQLGGGTFINKAIAYCQQHVTSPGNTILVLISDLYEGGVEQELLQRAADLLTSGVQFITLLALSDEGAPSYDQRIAQELSNLGAPCFACTPDFFPGMMAAAIKREDLNAWAAKNEITAKRKGARGLHLP